MPTDINLELYQFEGCPYCKKVRDFCSKNGISIILHTPRDGRTVVNEDRMAELEDGGKDQVPFLVDRDRDVALYESDDIIEYLDQHYA